MTDAIDRLDWPALGVDLLERGYARAEEVLSPDACAAFRACWGRDGLFRRLIVMERHGYGEGAYGYFADPLPEPVQALREGLYRHLAPLADEAMVRLGRQARYPADHAAYRAECHAAGQTKPTPLLLRYREGGYNRLHRDLYGELAFPFQATLLLSQPGIDYTGGEFLLVENRMRMQAMGEAVPLGQGDMVVFPVRDRPWRAGAAMSGRKCATASRACAPANGSRSASSSTTRHSLSGRRGAPCAATGD